MVFKPPRKSWAIGVRGEGLGMLSKSAAAFSVNQSNFNSDVLAWLGPQAPALACSTETQVEEFAK